MWFTEISHIFWFTKWDTWYKKEWTDMRYPLEWNQSTFMDWTKVLVQNSQKVTNYAKCQRIKQWKCCDYNEQDEDTSPSKLVDNKELIFSESYHTEEVKKDFVTWITIFHWRFLLTHQNQECMETPMKIYPTVHQYLSLIIPTNPCFCIQ